MRKFSDWRVGASTACFGAWTPELCAEYRDAGIKSMELSQGYDSLLNQLLFIDRAEHIGETTRSYGVELRSLHLPFSGELDLSRPDEFAEKTVELHLRLIEASKRAGIPLMVVHPSSEPIKDEDRPTRLEISKKNLKVLGERCTEYGIKLCVENLPRTCLGRCSGDLIYLIGDEPNIFCVYDTNHLLMQDNIEFIREIGHKIIALHVSDYDFIDERHLIPGMGKNDWKGIINALEAAGYPGDWTYELKREWTAKQVYENKKQLEELL
ncbi:MAG TPA: sugar phosphate isomerase/epimerase [Clostridiales bacterium]|jgi:sugar phosphate isomerase/epimerase|nr:sugar phosphate isomerase/epimerase [Clostridiales bacterium]